ncbi:MAG: radical SAM protein [Anaerolineae bacterium]|nr:radical SAM protein [Anaerolineae bacterium]
MSNTIKPRRLRLEASSICQLRCPSCPNTSKVLQFVIGSGFLKLQDFQNLVDSNPWLAEIELSNYGEIFLNPDLLEIMKYACEHHVVLRADNGVNLNHVREEVLEGLVRYRFGSMTCSLDGASNETYQMYRVGGHFETVIENIRKINHYKQKYRSDYPRLAWQFVVFGHNEHEIPAARKLAHELGMAFRPKLSWDANFSPVRDAEFVKRETGLDAVSRQEFKAKRGVDYARICYQLWLEPQVNWDGKILGCCRNTWGDFGGNAFRDGLLESLNSERMRYAREMLRGKRVARGDIPCTTCDIYLSMRADGSWVTQEELSRGGVRLLHRAVRRARRVLRAYARRK